MPGAFSVIYLLCQSFLLSVVLLSTASAEVGPTLKLKDEVLVLRRTYSLAEIAELDRLSPSLQERLSDVVVGFSPRPGQLDQVTRFELGTRLEVEIPGLSQRLRWDGPTSVRVRGGGVAADVDALRRAAQATLSNWLDERFEQTTLKGVGTLKKMTVPVGEIVFRPRVRLGQRLRKRIPVWVDVLVDKQHFQTVPVWFAVSVQAPVLMLKQAFDKHHQLQIEDVTEAVLDITTLKAVPVVKGSLLTKRLSRAMDDGSVLTEDDVELTPAVSQGQLITVFAQHGGVSLISKGIALADGAVQQTIAVRNPDSGESYRAMVIGNEQARVN